MPAEVYVVVYDLIQPLNAGLRLLGTGAFHVGVEVHGKEWGYGFSYMGTGIFTCEPQVRTGMQKRETMLHGETVLSDNQVEELLSQLRPEWIGADYDLLSRSCCSFADLFCQILGTGPLPSWVANLAAAGATVTGGCLSVMTAEQRDIVLSKAKIGEIDRKYTVESGATASASSHFKGPNGRREETPCFCVALGQCVTPVRAEVIKPVKVEEEVAPDSPKRALVSPRAVQNGQAAPTLLGQRGFHRAAPVTEEVAVNNRRQQKDCGCCTQ